MHKTINKPFAEVIESNIQGFIAQSWVWHDFPSFGSLVTTQQNNRIMVALVYNITTGSMDPSRHPFPYQKTEQELLDEQPHIFEFLKTTFLCVFLGYKEKNVIYHQLPPEPSKIHTFIFPADEHLVKEFLSTQRYLHILHHAASLTQNFDEILLALLKTQNALGITSSAFIKEFINTYSLLTNSDYRRLKIFLQRIQPLLHTEYLP